nr:retrotransposon protein, putative, Ty1-copia subclass [Tanacetum cinerariifolium]
KKCIEKLQQEGLLRSTDNESFDQCVSCLSGKMTRKSFPHRPEKATDLLGIIHTDVCGLLRHVSRQGASYFITFTDDYSCYGYVYLLKHKHEVFETFKVFKNKMENQPGKTIKALRSGRGDEYISQEFKYYLKAYGIIQQLTPPYTPQHNDVSERRNHTLLDMVRSMMNLITLPLSFWDYALESATRILNMVPTKKVDKTPYELWKSFPHRPEKATGLLGIIHTDVCGLLRHVSRQGASYFITFTNDYSRYGYVCLLKHKHEVFETFKVFKNKVENQPGKTIKALRSGRGDEYISQEFKYYLKAYGIVQQLTPPYTPQHNGVSERRNHTLLDMVRSMMNLITLPLSFWDYVLESATRILNMVPTKKVDKTPYELWYGKVPNLSYLKVSGCEALVKRDTPDKLQQRSVKFVARYAEFFEKNVITQEVSGRAINLEEIRDKDTSPSEITSEIPIEVEEVEDHSLGDLNEPASYKAAMLDSKSNKWVDAMNAEIQSMI